MSTTPILSPGIFVTDEGAGDLTFVLVHGYACDSHDWNWQIERLLAAGHRVVAADNRGHGRSGCAASYQVEDVLGDLIGLVAGIGARPVVVVGHSFGGILATCLAVERPDLVQAVVAVDTALGIMPEYAGRAEALCAGMRSDPLATAVLAFSGLDSEHTPPGLVTWRRRRILGMRPEVVAETFTGIFESGARYGLREHAAPLLQRLERPLLGVYRDPAHAAWASDLTDSQRDRHVSWEGHGHWPHQERPREFTEMMLGWLEGPHLLPTGRAAMNT